MNADFWPLHPRDSALGNPGEVSKYLGGASDPGRPKTSFKKLCFSVCHYGTSHKNKIK